MADRPFRPETLAWAGPCSDAPASEAGLRHLLGKDVIADIVGQVDQLFTAINYVTPAAIAGLEDL